MCARTVARAIAAWLRIFESSVNRIESRDIDVA
jgi:hypothetical protein